MSKFVEGTEGIPLTVDSDDEEEEGSSR